MQLLALVTHDRFMMLRRIHFADWLSCVSASSDTVTLPGLQELLGCGFLCSTSCSFELAGSDKAWDMDLNVFSARVFLF